MAQLSNSWRQQIDGRRAGLGMSQSVLASLAGISENKLSGFIVGAKPLENTELTALYNILRDCERLAELAEPLPIDFKNRIGLLNALEALKLGDLRPVRKHAGEASVA